MSKKKKKVKLKLLRRSCIYVWAKEKGTKRGNKLYDTFYGRVHISTEI